MLDLSIVVPTIGTNALITLPQVGVYLFSGDYGTVSHCQSWIRPSRVHVMFAIHGLIIRLPMQVDGRESWGDLGMRLCRSKSFVCFD